MTSKNVKEVKEVRGDFGNYRIIIAEIDGVKHMTTDVRRIGQNTYAVFSDTTAGPSFMEGVLYLIYKGIYTSSAVEALCVQDDHYIWIKIKPKK